MRTMTHTLKILAAVCLLAVIAAVAPAKDVVVLENGRRVEGDIIREIDGNIWMLVYFGDIKKQEFFAAAVVEEVIRDATVDEADREDEPERRAAHPGVKKGTVITLEGMVGIEFAHRRLESLIPLIEEEIGEDGVLVLKINSGGGALMEIMPLSDVIEHKLKPKFEVVGWVESAISAAAMTGATMERLFFMPQGNLGACTGWYGALQAVKGRDLEEVKYMMQKIMARGQRDYKIMESMQVGVPLSATIDENGDVHWYQDEDSGEILVNPTGEILTLNSQQAEDLLFSEGIARTLDDLTEQLGYEEIEWVGKWQDDLIFPVGKAERENRRWRELIDQSNQGLAIEMSKYQLYLATARGTADDNRAKMVGRARRHLRGVRRYFRESPNSILFSLGLPPDEFDYWYEDQEEILRDLMRD